MKPQKIGIVGAGLVGSLLATVLKERGHTVSLFERRRDPRKDKDAVGRSINLALSDRGRKALRLIDMEQSVMKHATKKIRS